MHAAAKQVLEDRRYQPAENQYKMRKQSTQASP